MPVEIVDETGDASSSASIPTSAARSSGGPAAGRPLAAVAQQAAGEILSCLGRADDELCVVLVGDARIRELNRDWRDKDSPTDVLSFSQIEGESLASSSSAMMLGDVVVSVDTLRRQAADGGWSDQEELVRLVLHGVLHLLGFDHEREEDAETMRAEERRIVRMLASRGIGCAWEEDA
jgi:probable rRNA maturation factor